MEEMTASHRYLYCETILTDQHKQNVWHFNFWKFFMSLQIFFIDDVLLMDRRNTHLSPLTFEITLETLLCN